MWMVSLGILALLPLTFTTSRGNRHRSSCVPSLHTPPNPQPSTTEGQALILRCPARSCSEELPSMTWCRIQTEDVCQALTTGPRVFFQWERDVYVLKFVPAHRNDTGYYRCSADFGEQRITGNLIRVNVTCPHECVIRDTSKTWIAYFSIAIPLSITIVFYMWIYCQLRQVTVGNKISNCKPGRRKVNYVPPSRTAVPVTKHHPKMSCDRSVDRDPPTECFEMICEDLDTCDYEREPE
ncbi:B- and T-lymphocyte attenuator-like [Dendropsophus ebraccatus]|uniref:B- and T-lymphocyte attenuator-like n=1 Tax=Dendropsophus ebraccatus TaxID=150705 RepID=UPI0038322330